MSFRICFFPIGQIVSQGCAPAASLACVLSLLGVASAATEPPAASQVRRVVVYPDRALVTREASVACGDRALVRFEHLPPSADAASLRAQTSLGRIEGLRTEDQPRRAAFSQAVAAMDDALRQHQRDLAALRAAESRDEAAVQLAARYETVASTLISRELSDPGATKPPPSWNSALDTALTARVQVATTRAERQRQTRELQAQISDLQQQRSLQLQAGSRRDLSAEVLLSCPPGQRASVELSYLVGGAGFVPAHEARLDERAGRVILTSFATLQQSTGEDWPAIALTLSTAAPQKNATPPTVGPLRVFADPREPPKKIVVSRSEQHEHAEAPGEPSKNSGGEAGASTRHPAQPQGLSVQFPVAMATSVRGDGTPLRVTLADSALTAQIAYRSVPKLLPYVFRVADLTNSAGYPLLSGDLDVFRGGQFVARYPLDYIAAGARFQLSFGLEDRLRIRRKTVDEVARDRGLFAGTRRHHYAYRFEVQSFLDRADQLEIAEHIPVSELSDIRVELHPSTSPGYAVQPQDGIVRFRVPLRPGESKTLSLAYFVDVPSSYSE